MDDRSSLAGEEVDEVSEFSAPTANSRVRNYVPNQNETHAYSVDTNWLLDTSNLLNKAARKIHRNRREDDLGKAAHLKARKGVPALLDELGVERGLAWSDISQLVGVSVSAIRKWRKGGDASPESRLKLARLATFLDFLGDLPVHDPAQWLEIPFSLGEGIVLTAFDVYRAGGETQLLELAAGRSSIEQVLDEVEPGWRTSRRTAFDVFLAPDGHRGIRFRDEQ